MIWRAFEYSGFLNLNVFLSTSIDGLCTIHLNWFASTLIQVVNIFDTLVIEKPNLWASSALNLACSSKIVISAIYRPPDSTPSYDFHSVTELTSHLDNSARLLKSHSLILGDFNYPAIKWIEGCFLWNSTRPFSTASEPFSDPQGEYSGLNNNWCTWPRNEHRDLHSYTCWPWDRPRPTWIWLCSQAS